MADIGTDREVLERFEKRIGKLLDKFQSSKVLDARSRRHQRELENLLERTNKILSDEATRTEVNGFDELIDTTEKSFKQLKENHKDDQKFQKEFQKAFGEDKRAGTIAKEISEKMAASMSDVVRSVNVINKQEVDRSMSTAMQAATGPLGQMFKETIDTSGLKQVFSRSRSRPDMASRNADPSIRGMFHDGIANVPQEGSYLLDKNERVVSPDQNEDLTSFLDKVGRLTSGNQQQTNADQLVRVLTHDSSRDYFEPLIEHRDAIYNKEQKTRRQYHSEEMLQMSSLRSTMEKESQNSILAAMTSVSLFYRRFERHPIMNTIDLTFKAIRALPKAMTGIFKWVWKSVFGEEMSAEERTAENTRRMYEFMTTGQESGRVQTGMQKLSRWINTFGGATTRAAQRGQIAEERKTVAQRKLQQVGGDEEKLSDEDRESLRGPTWFQKRALKRQGQFITKGLGRQQEDSPNAPRPSTRTGVGTVMNTMLPKQSYPSDRSSRAKAMPRDKKGRFMSREAYEAQENRETELGLFEKMELHQFKILEILEDGSGSGGDSGGLSGLGARLATLAGSIASLAAWKVTLPAAIGAAIGTGINRFWQNNAPDSYRTSSDVVGVTIDSVRAAAGNEDAQRRINQNETANSMFETMDSISGFMGMKWDATKAAYGNREARERLVENPGYRPDNSAVGRWVREERERRRNEENSSRRGRGNILHSILMGEDIATQAIRRQMELNNQESTDTNASVPVMPRNDNNPDTQAPSHNNAYMEPSETQTDASMSNMARDINRMTALNEMTRNQLEQMQQMNDNMARLVSISDQMNRTTKDQATRRQSPVFRNPQTDLLTEG